LAKRKKTFEEKNIIHGFIIFMTFVLSISSWLWLLIFTYFFDIPYFATALTITIVGIILCLLISLYKIPITKEDMEQRDARIKLLGYSYEEVKEAKRMGFSDTEILEEIIHYTDYTFNDLRNDRLLGYSDEQIISMRCRGIGMLDKMNIKL